MEMVEELMAVEPSRIHLKHRRYFVVVYLIMATERSPLGSYSVPRYTFLGSGSQPKQKCGRLQCCIAATLIASLVVVLVLILAFYVNQIYPDGTPKNDSQGLDGLLQVQWPLKEENYTELQSDANDELRALEMGAEALKARDTIEAILPHVPVDSPEFRHQIATYTTQQAQEMSRLGFVIDLASKEMNKCYDNTTDRNKRTPKRWLLSKHGKWSPREECQNMRMICKVSPYRTADGICNNLQNPIWGASLRSFRRILLPDYADGISDPRKASDGSDLPSAREVSLAIHRPAYQSDQNFTVMLAVWGQFIDHDITATAISRGRNGSAIKCCQTKNVHPECFPVLLGPQDPFYLQYNVTCMEFVRSAPAPICSLGSREQINQATSFLDGSVVYGNDDDTMNQLRTFTGGELRMLKKVEGDLLPISEDISDGCNRKEEFERGRYCFLSGDRRSNENMLLTSMHLLFARQHNLIAKKLSGINSHWTDEKLFQETRKIISAQIEHITYNEFLPSVLPEELIFRLKILTRNEELSDLYNSSINPTVSNVFASAAFRFGHTLLPGLLQFLHDNSTREEYIQLHKMLFNPFAMFEKGFLESVMRGAINTSSAKSDVYFTQEVTQKLFQREPKNPCGLDLVSLNIQRGRDHGLPAYPNWRPVCGLKKPKTFDDLKDDIDEETVAQLKNLYKSVEDLDLYTGGLAEKPVKGGLVGPTITCLLADQFLRLKIGDRFWYERMEGPQRFKPEQLLEIRKSSLAKLICDTSGVTQVQPDVMRRPGKGNELKPCHEFSYPDFQAWEEVPDELYSF